MTEKKPTLKEIDLGATGLIAAANIERFRKEQGLNYKQLSERLHDLNHEIPPLGLRRIEARARKISVDDLIALSVALSVSPSRLLLPTDNAQSPIGTGMPKEVDLLDAEAWIRGETGLSLESRLSYWRNKHAISFADLERQKLRYKETFESFGDSEPNQLATMSLNYFKESIEQAEKLVAETKERADLLELLVNQRHEAQLK